MRKWILVLVVGLLPVEAWSDLSLFSFREVSIEYKAVKPGSRDPMFPQTPIAQGLNLNLDFEFLGFFYWENQVWSAIDCCQFRAIGWHFVIGARLLSFVDIRMDHFSRHWLDMGHQTAGFPVEDSISVMFYLYRSEPKGPSLLKWIWD